MREGRGLRDGLFFFLVVTRNAPARVCTDRVYENMRPRDCSLDGDSEGLAMTTADVSKRPPGWRGWLLLLAGFFGLFAGLCTVFALVVTAAEGWVEHVQAQWPTA